MESYGHYHFLRVTNLTDVDNASFSQDPVDEDYQSLLTYIIRQQDDEEASLHAFLLLGSMDWSEQPRPSGEFIDCLVRAMHSSRESLCHAALSAAYALRLQLAQLPLSADADLLCDRLSAALITVITPMKADNHELWRAASDNPLRLKTRLLHSNEYASLHYVQLIQALMVQVTWRAKCIQDGHMKSALMILEKLLTWKDMVIRGFMLAAKIISIGFASVDLGKPEIADEQAELLGFSWSLLMDALSTLEKGGRWLRLISPVEATIALALLPDLIPAISNIVTFMQETSSINAINYRNNYSEDAKKITETVRRLCSPIRRSRLFTLVFPENPQLPIEELAVLESRILDIAHKFGWPWAVETSNDGNAERGIHNTTDLNKKVTTLSDEKEVTQKISK
ncbi:hypothetical protein M422DRAFT_786157 [Sphaerobolus stellatus SS14]|uniref:Uncharacterized protein n=1 Tax=Sphaerobolus stellatus (strain SS14) TaxID=990650 RepID=A0A0C9UEA2_SPHS4|nr:hypothetical protein M422DRAFT_786157 [Sphaerobolus stellatus SS14]